VVVDCRDIKKNVHNKTNKRFVVGNTKINILTNQGYLRTRSFTKLYEVRRILFLEIAIAVGDKNSLGEGEANKIYPNIFSLARICPFCTMNIDLFYNAYVTSSRHSGSSRDAVGEVSRVKFCVKLSYIKFAASRCLILIFFVLNFALPFRLGI